MGPFTWSALQFERSVRLFGIRLPAARMVSQSIGPDRPHRRTVMFWEVLGSFPNCLLYWLAFSLTRCAALAEIRNRRRREEDGREPSQVYGAIRPVGASI